ncbi:MAG: hypothetical protein Q8928_02900 [Bacteroidota bacterium]|nr:hypothetical protein [Bacteroidota bacterium]
MLKKTEHSFHIPVLGIGYSVDTPAKVARYGISSVISLTEPTLCEKMRKHYCQKENEPYSEIKGFDAADKQITAYLNLLNKIVKKQFESLKQSAFEAGSELVKYFEMLPDTSLLKQAYQKLNQLSDSKEVEKMQQWLRSQITPGSIDVNIMTKLDKTNYAPDGSALPQEYNDAHSALRGFAQSELSSSIIFSAGMNPRLFTYLEQFPDFYPDENGQYKKSIILKVSDYRSALIQGKVLAKKGLWISEFRIESGLNCGGHAFATDGYLLGPILEEFKNNRESLYQMLLETYTQGLKSKNIELNKTPVFRITVQGGVGTPEEHNFLLRHYNMDSIGWGSPFLLVPEAMNVDEKTIEQFGKATEDDYFISEASPLGVLFNNFRPSSMNIEKKKRLQEGKPGWACIKGHLSFNTTYTEKPICTASKQYMRERTKEINTQNLTPEEKAAALDLMAEKSCLCVGLSTTSLIVNDIPLETEFVSICPGPNLAYFHKKATLREMIDHIYGRINLADLNTRPNMFVKELSLYVDYLKKKLDDNNALINDKNRQYLANFQAKLIEGIEYYHTLIPELKEESDKVKEKMQQALKNFEAILQGLQIAVVK